MNNINPIYSINNCYLPTFKRKEVSNNVVSNPINTNVSVNGVEALANYNLGSLSKFNDTPAYINQSLEEHLTSLKANGKKEGIDYNVEKFKDDNRWLNLIDKNGNITDCIEYVDGKFVSCEINTYQNGKLIKRIGRSENRIETSEKMYYRNEYPHESFTKAGINYKTNPEQFVEYLKNNNIKYKINYEGEEDNNRSVILTEYDKNGKAIRGYWWYYGENHFDEQFPWVSVSELNENEEEIRRISFDKEKTEICDYNYLTKTKDQNNLEYDVKTLTEAGVTYKTTPQEYIKYLNKQGIKYKIKESRELSKDFEIDELDDKGNTKTSTSWIYEQNSNNLERICRWEESDIGRKRFDFYPDVTETMTLRYIN